MKTFYIIFKARYLFLYVYYTFMSYICIGAYCKDAFKIYKFIIKNIIFQSTIFK